MKSWDAEYVTRRVGKVQQDRVAGYESKVEKHRIVAAILVL
jgi:hypothetical protein